MGNSESNKQQMERMKQSKNKQPTGTQTQIKQQKIKRN